MGASSLIPARLGGPTLEPRETDDAMNSLCLTESTDERNLPMCKEIGEILHAAYPGYDWSVRIDGGVLIIKNLHISKVWGMVRKFETIAHDAGARKREIVMAAGAFLEAANMRRGARREGEYATTLEGRPDGSKYTPPRVIQ